MSSTSDIRDIMNLGQAGPRQPAPKKKKAVENGPRVTGVRREVQALMGDSVPPIAIVEQRSYKSRPSISQKLFKPRHWEERTFQHGGRSDGLVLRHWKRSIPGSNARAPVVANGSADVEMTDDAKTVQELKFEDEYPSHKWNVKVQAPAYTDEQYDNMLRSEDWTRQETDYLIDLCREYDLRWIIIADRYNPSDIPSLTPAPQPVEPPSTDVVTKPHYPPRAMEALKQRYYAIAASLMEQTTPASTMTATEFQLWEKMRTFDAKTETMRKAMAEKLFERTKDEADEERILLEELHRITKNEDDFVKMRRDLYARLEPVAPLRRSGNGEEQSTAMYQTSGGLSMLLQTLLAKEKRLKRPTLPDGTAGPSGTPTDARAEKARQSSQYGRRDTLDTQATGDEPQKKGSVSQAPTVRILSPADAAKFGVSHPQDRLTSGVQFRHEKISRLTMAKSQTQTTKIQAALTELGIPPRLLMPTERVCREFERLVGEINILLDCRKVGEKVSSEVKVLEEMRRVRLGLPKEGDGAGAGTGNTETKDTSAFPNTTDAMEIDDSQVGDTSKVNESVVPEEDEDAEAEEDDEAAEAAQKAASADAQNDESSMQVDREAQDDDDADEDEDADESAAAVKRAEEDEDDEEDQDDEDVTGLDNDEDQDEDDDDDDDGPQLNVDDDDDEEDEDEDEDEEVAPTPQEDSDAEEEADSDDEAEAAAAAQAQAEAEAESSAESEDDAEAELNEDDSDAEAQAQAAAEASSEEESDQGVDQDDEDEEPSAPQAADEDEDEDDGEEEAEPEPGPEPVPAVRAHKRSASVVSEASRAGSNRSGVGRKKRR
ncbi:swr complex subunit [Cladophialophora chaetospira]|uniref:SWR1-complex protein 4 n=1 Tax=Cladophialophora chaetospira TaxID=386627 RepID=A0AA38X624_9EURO|nr:swr complex subunit [Cladophialophora chaetospira]